MYSWRADVSNENDRRRTLDVNALAQEQRDRLPGIVSEIEALLRTVDPIELLSHLTVLYQTHAIDAANDRNERARWQAKIEWLAWLALSRKIASPERPAVIDGGFLSALERLLDDYFRTVVFSLMGRDPALDAQQNELRARIQTEAVFVRGLGYANEIEGLAVELYSPHEAWCLTNLGLPVQDAFEIAKIIGEGVSDKIADLRARSREIEKDVEHNHESVTHHLEGFPVVIREAVADGSLITGGSQFAKTLSIIWLFFKAPTIISFTEDELRGRCEGRVAAERVLPFLTLLSVAGDKISGEPSAVELNPFAFAPFVKFGDRYYLFVPPRLSEAIFYAFHTKLFADKSYRTTYDNARAEWLESSAVSALERLLLRAECGWGLYYGPKKERLELDGIAVYDNKLILIECKSKSPTLAALAGDVPAILNDLAKAILEPFDQAKRARDYIQGAASVEFEEKRTGRKIVVRRAEISEVFLVTLVGTGAWASIAANLPSLAPLGLFVDRAYPWALSLADLRVVTESLELPSQLFDYLYRRYAVQKDGRFYLHDEWDFLGVYFAGVLDPNSPSFAEASDANSIALDGFDDELQDYYYAMLSFERRSTASMR